MYHYCDVHFTTIFAGMTETSVPAGSNNGYPYDVCICRQCHSIILIRGCAIATI